MTLPEAIRHAATEFIRDRRPLEAFVYGLFRDAPAAAEDLRDLTLLVAEPPVPVLNLPQAAWLTVLNSMTEEEKQ